MAPEHGLALRGRFEKDKSRQLEGAAGAAGAAG